MLWLTTIQSEINCRAFFSVCNILCGGEKIYSQVGFPISRLIRRVWPVHHADELEKCKNHCRYILNADVVSEMLLHAYAECLRYIQCARYWCAHQIFSFIYILIVASFSFLAAGHQPILFEWIQVLFCSCWISALFSTLLFENTGYYVWILTAERASYTIYYILYNWILQRSIRLRLVYKYCGPKLWAPVSGQFSYLIDGFFVSYQCVFIFDSRILWFHANHGWILSFESRIMRKWKCSVFY